MSKIGKNFYDINHHHHYHHHVANKLLGNQLVIKQKTQVFQVKKQLNKRKTSQKFRRYIIFEHRHGSQACQKSF